MMPKWRRRVILDITCLTSIHLVTGAKGICHCILVLVSSETFRTSRTQHKTDLTRDQKLPKEATRQKNSKLDRMSSKKFSRHLIHRARTSIKTCKRASHDSGMNSQCMPLVGCDAFSTVHNPLGKHRVTINVSGERYQTYLTTLEKFPNTLLGDDKRREKYYLPEENEYFFDRDRAAFAAIIYFYQSDGQFYCPVTVPLHILVSEANFFDLGPVALNQVLDVEDSEEVELPKNRLKREIWKLFEIPDSGVAANILTVFSVIIIIFSVSILCIETLPFFKDYNNSNVSCKQNCPPITSKLPKARLQAPSSTFQKKNESVSNQVPKKMAKSRKHNVNWKNIFELCETGIVAWFTLEFLVRFLSCPNKIKFSKSCMNIIDFLAIVPYYVTLIFREETIGLDNIRIIRLVRVFRIFKLSRHSRGLQILGLTLKASIEELGLLIFFLLIGVVLFSSAVYYVEMQNFQSIPHAFWWAIITMCTVGYGDNVPETFPGKIIGSLCAICGVLTIALPVPVIVSNFDYFYKKKRARKFHGNVKESCSKDLPDHLTRKKMDPAAEEFHRRQERMDRQKQLKRLISNQGKFNGKISRAFFSRKHAHQNGSVVENPRLMERESVM